jgi:hypothetical protein
MMEIVIKIPEDVYTRLFDNGIQDNEIAVDDVCEMARALRLGKPLPKRHGRLIDADALVNSLGASDRDIYCKAVIEEDAPIII